MTSARVTTLPTDTTKAANEAAEEKRETAAAYRKAAQFVGKQDVKDPRIGLSFAHGPNSPQAQLTKALRDEATKLEEAAKVDEFAAKAVPMSEMTANARPDKIYGPDDKGRFWRVDQAELMPAAATVRLNSANGARFDLAGRGPQYRLTLTQVKP